jgi:hypothetical protein
LLYKMRKLEIDQAVGTLRTAASGA